jgi:RNA polymerase sigma-70 factor (ECF subfamily)
MLAEIPSFEENSVKEVLEAVISLPSKYKDAIYLHYYEGYSAAEIAKILKTRENTVYSLLARGRAKLKEKLGGDGYER